MKGNISYFLCLTFFVYQCSQKTPEKNSKEKAAIAIGNYLGQEPPGPEPKLFAPGIVSTDSSELNAVFSPDGKEFLFSRKINNRLVILLMEQNEKGEWGKPIELINDLSSKADPYYSPDGNRIYYVSNKPKKSIGRPHSIFYIERVKDGWGAPVKMGHPINSEANEIYPSFTNDGTMYFNSNRDGNKDIYRSVPVDGKYENIEKLGDSINTQYDEGDVYIDPNEEFIIFNSKDGIKISFMSEDGKWLKSKLMGKGINLNGSEYTPIVSPDGKYFFFTRNNDLYWVSSKIIEDYK